MSTMILARKILAPLVLLAASLLPVAAAAPAHAGYPGGAIIHTSPDYGYDAPFTLYCSNGTVARLHEGSGSKSYCRDVDQISLLAGQKLVCRSNYNNSRRVFYPGVTNISDWYSASCVMQRL